MLEDVIIVCFTVFVFSVFTYLILVFGLERRSM